MDKSHNGVVTHASPPRLGAVLTRALDQQFATFRSLVQSLRRKVKKDNIHDVRVAVRRINALLDLLRETVPVPDASRLRKRLKKCMKSVGDLRDTQVQRALVDDLADTLPDASVYGRELKQREKKLRRRARRDMRDVHLRSLRRLKDKIQAQLAPHWSHHLQERQRSQAMGGVDRAFSTVVEARRRLDVTHPETVHAMRVAFKKFRYMVEVLQPLLSGVGKSQLASMHAFQGMMGDIHDLDVLTRDVSRVRQHSHRPVRLAAVQDELAHRLLMATDAFMAASDELFTFWNQAWFSDL